MYFQIIYFPSASKALTNQGYKPMNYRANDHLETKGSHQRRVSNVLELWSNNYMMDNDHEQNKKLD